MDPNDEDRDAILARRRRFVSIALSGLATTGTLSCDDPPAPIPGPCLTAEDPAQTTTPPVERPEPPAMPCLEPEVVDEPPEPPRADPQPCLSPMPCLSPPVIEHDTGRVLLSTRPTPGEITDSTGRVLGVTPAVLELPPGTHELTLRPIRGGGRPRTVEVEVVAGETVRLIRRLD